MASNEDERRKQRAQARAGWSVRKFTLATEETDDLSALTPSERIALVWRLTQDAWAFKAEPMPTYSRHDIPGKVIRSGERS